MPQFSSLSDIEAALQNGGLTGDYELLLSEKMVRDQNAEHVLALLRQRGVSFTVSPHHYGDAIASRAERRPPS
jgi:hypothetical protein